MNKIITRTLCILVFLPTVFAICDSVELRQKTHDSFEIHIPATQNTVCLITVEETTLMQTITLTVLSHLTEILLFFILLIGILFLQDKKPLQKKETVKPALS
ncbi:MAG: hypothetical protein ACMXYA_02865 [Candidatus Woesearchaeota archaeon]